MERSRINDISPGCRDRINAMYDENPELFPDRPAIPSHQFPSSSAYSIYGNSNPETVTDTEPSLVVQQAQPNCNGWDWHSTGCR